MCFILRSIIGKPAFLFVLLYIYLGDRKSKCEKFLRRFSGKFCLENRIVLNGFCHMRNFRNFVFGRTIVRYAGNTGIWRSLFFCILFSRISMSEPVVKRSHCPECETILIGVRNNFNINSKYGKFESDKTAYLRR